MKIQFTTTLLVLLLDQVQGASTRGATQNKRRIKTGAGMSKGTKGSKGGKGRSSSSSSSDLGTVVPTLERIVEASDETEETLIPTFEGIAAFEESASNDGSHLEHICGLFADFSSFPNCQDFELFHRLLCPRPYQVDKICASTATNLTTATMEGYCSPLFRPLQEQQGPCQDLCIEFMQADCCNVVCP